MQAQTQDISGYRFRDEHIPSVGYMVPVLKSLIQETMGPPPQRIFDLGCGKGDMAAALAADGHSVCGIDPSTDGIALANKYYPGLNLAEGSAYDDLAATYGKFSVVMSVDVVECVYYPQRYARTIRDLVEPGGVALVTAPYHGYLKNVAIALSGSMDRHFNSLQEFGRIKFWSMETLGALLKGAGFASVEFHRVGRVPAVAKAMIAVARL